MKLPLFRTWPAGLVALAVTLGTLSVRAQDPEEPVPTPEPVVAPGDAVIQAVAEPPEEEPGSEPEQPSDERGGRGEIPGEAQAGAAAVLGSTNAPAAEGEDRGSRRERSSGRSRERTPRDWRSSFPSRGSKDARGSSQTNSTGPASTEYAFFQVINNRNIFNPARQPNVPDRPKADPKRPPKVDSFSLVGTMQSGKGTMAFFDGSSGDFRKAHKVGGEIAGYRIVSVTVSAVKLESKGKIVELAIGSQMRREDEGDWNLASGPYTGSGRGEESGSAGSGRSSTGGSDPEGSAAATTTTAAASSSSSGSGGGSADEVLKRLLQRREQENNK